MIFYIEKIKIELTENAYGLKLNALNDVFPLPGQTVAETINTITKNFDIVSTKYRKIATDIVTAEDLNEVSLKIVFHYFYLYNSWRKLYKKEKNRSLRSCLKFIYRFPHGSFWLQLRWIFRRRGLRLWLQNPPRFAKKYPMGNFSNKI
ncbi:hypothetical protein BH10BAC3_BH10BAC3_05190 [soil metagenome]